MAVLILAIAEIWWVSTRPEPSPGPLVVALAPARPEPQVDTATLASTRQAESPSRPDPSRFSLNDGFCDPAEEADQGLQLTITASATRIPGVRPALDEARRARHLGDTRAEREALAKAHRLAPTDHGIARAYAMNAMHASQVGLALQALDDAYGGHDRDPHVERLRARLRVQLEIQRDFDRLERHGLTLSYPRDALDVRAAGAHLDAVDLAMDEADALTGTPRLPELSIVIYRDRSELLAVGCAPSWSGAVFDGTLRLQLGAGKLDEAQLRHETLHAVLRDLHGRPRWFHEGLAQWFEAHGKLRWSKRYQAMLESRTYVPFRSLEDSFFVFTEDEDAALAYDQSRAMIAVLVEKRGERGISEAVSLLRDPHPPVSLTERLGLTEAELLGLLERAQPR